MVAYHTKKKSLKNNNDFIIFQKFSINCQSFYIPQIHSIFQQINIFFKLLLILLINSKNNLIQNFRKLTEHLNHLDMNSLHTKIEEAAKLFQNHDFKKALQLYDQCINISKKNQEPKTLIYNLLSSKGALMSILGDQKGALETLNQVLKEDPYHVLCLMRRSQVYKKKNQLNKALKDLEVLGNFSPDNLQIAAMKVEIQNMKLKNKQVSSSSQSESDSEKSGSQDDLDEEQQLNFSNLRLIDRKSVSIMIKPEARKSRVTIAGDIAIQYQAAQDDTKDNKSFASTNVSKQYAKEKYMKTFREIEMDEQQTKQSSNKSIEVPVIKVKSTAPTRTKSILKNRDSIIYVNNEKPVEKEKKYGGRESKMIDLLKNIDGKVITHAGSERTSMSVKEVEFRKSMFGGTQQLKALTQGFSQNQSSTKPKTVRKSCLKRPSFQVSQQQGKTGKSGPRRSKFDSMSMKGIDGIVIKNHHQSIEKDEVLNDRSISDSDSDEGSEHNIFGKNKIVISKEVRQTLGLGEDSLNTKKEKQAPKLRAPGGKSILKKSSVMIRSTQKDSSPMKQIKKVKKSVMFTRAQ